MHLRKGDLQASTGRRWSAPRASSPPTPTCKKSSAEIYEAIHRPADAIVYFAARSTTIPKSIAALNGARHGVFRRARLRESATSIPHRLPQRRPARTTRASTTSAVAKIQAGKYDEAIDELKIARIAGARAPRSDRELRLPRRSRTAIGSAP